jgi:type I restriction-modification system specificity subunit S
MTPEIKRRIEQMRQGDIPAGYKKAASGIAPADWKRYTFGDIYTERKEPGSEELPLLMVSIHSGVSDGEVDETELPKKIKRIEDKSQYKKAMSGDLVFNMMRAWQGSIGTVRTTGMVSPAYIVAEPNDKVYPLFMDYYTRTPQMINQIDRQSYGVTDFRKRLYWDSFTPIGCILPTIAEQQKISTILAIQDKVIELKEKRLAEKQRQKKYLMQQLLTGKKRLPGFSGEWKATRLRNIVKRHTKRNTIGNTNVLTISAQYGLINQAEFFNKAVASDDKSNYFLLQKGDFAYNKSYSNGYPFGAIKRLTRYGVGIVSPLYICFRIKDGSVSGKYLEQYFEAGLMNHEIQAFAQEGARNHGLLNIAVDDFFNSKILLPLLKEQAAIAEVLSAADHEIELLRQDIEQEKQKKKALMQLLLTGIVRVNA